MLLKYHVWPVSNIQISKLHVSSSEQYYMEKSILLLDDKLPKKGKSFSMVSPISCNIHDLLCDSYLEASDFLL